MPRTGSAGTFPSPGPARRRSLLARYASTGSTEDNFNKKISAQVTVQPSSARALLPTELLDHIITLFTISFCLPVPTRNTTFALIKPLTLVSKAFRLLVLRRYFAIFVLEKKPSIGLFHFLKNEDAANRQRGRTGGFDWVRSVLRVYFCVKTIQCRYDTYKKKKWRIY